MIHGYIVIRKRSGADGPQFPVKKSVKIGRGTHCDVRIHVQSVSEQHCLILVEKDQRAMIQNLSTTSQTLVNGVPIGKGTCALKNGDTVTVGERSFKWYYGQQTPFFEGKRNILRRRKSEGDSKGSQNVAVVNPLYHKRRTMGVQISYTEPSRTPKKLLKAGAPVSVKNQEQSSSKSPKARLSAKTPQSRLSTPKARTPSGTSAGKSPKISTPTHKSQRGKSPEAPSPLPKTPAVQSVKRFSILETFKSPVANSNASNSETKKSSAEVLHPQTPRNIKSPVATSNKNSNGKSPKGKTPDVSSAARTPLAKSPGRRSSILKTSKSLKVKIPAARASTSRKKSMSAAKSQKSPKAQKRRLSSPARVAPKRLKIESPKSIDKKKMAVLMGIHGRTRVATSSTLSTVKVVLSVKKTPIIKPTNSVKKGSVVKSSVKKARRPLFSEILKKKAVQTVNTAAKKLTLVPKPTKVLSKKPLAPGLSTEIPQKFKFGSTGHANSPEPIFIGRKVAKTPVATKKGQKVSVFVAKSVKGNLDLTGVSEMFKTPVKTGASASVSSSSSTVKKGKGNRSISSPSPSATSSQASRTSRSSQPTPSPSKTFSAKKVSESPIKLNKTRGTPYLSASKSSGRSSISTPSSHSREPPRRRSSVSVGTPTVSMSVLTTKRHPSLLTSTPAVVQRQSLAGSLFESPSSVLIGKMNTPQSPTSGRKSRLEMRGSRTPLSHSPPVPYASPIKSSLKSSPEKSPEKNLSVSFNDSIDIKVLVSGSRKSLNTTAQLSCPGSEEHSGIATPDATTFDFNSIKTPNVPREMFVSSILSSGASTSSNQTSGSGKRKGQAPKSPLNDLRDVQGVKRLLKTPASPAGYVDVKGVKRLMTAAPKTPTYLAVEGVKKLFGDATAAAGSALTDFPGVRELFASPSPIKTKSRVSLSASPKATSPRSSPVAKSRASLSASPKATSPRSSPVAKIVAEVETKGRPSTELALCDVNGSPKSMQRSARRSSGVKSSPATSPVRGTPVKRGRRATRKKAESPSKASPVAKEGKVKPKRGRAVVKKEELNKNTPVKETTPQQMESPQKTSRHTRKEENITATSPPKTRARRVIAVSSPVMKSPVQDVPKRARRGAARVAVKTSPVRKEESASPMRSPQNSPVVAKRVTRRKTTAPKTLSPATTPPTRRATRKGTNTTSVSPKTKASKKRALSPSKAESPTKRLKNDEAKAVSPEKASPKRATRRARKEPTGKKEIIEQTATPSDRKQKAVTFKEDLVTPSKKRKTASKESNPSTHDITPEKSKKTRRAPSKKNQQQSQATSPGRKAAASKKTSSPKLASPTSPRRTRSRK